MKQLLALSLNDFRVTFRDPMFRALLFFPFVSFALVKWAVPALVAAYPPAAGFQLVVLMWACQQSAVMFGFIYGFIFLEEKEIDVWQALRILPVSNLLLTGSRLAIGLIVSSLVNWTMIHAGGVITVPFWQEALLAINFSMLAPLMALVLGTFAQNRIEGLAQIKIVNLLVILPALIYFLPYQWMNVLAVVPPYWSFRAMEYAAKGDQAFWLFYLVGVIFSGLLCWWLSRRMQNGRA